MTQMNDQIFIITEQNNLINQIALTMSILYYIKLIPQNIYIYIVLSCSLYVLF